MAKRPRHPSKEVEVEDEGAAAEAKGWTWRKQGHWGRLYCPHASRDGCQVGLTELRKTREITPGKSPEPSIAARTERKTNNEHLRVQHHCVWSRSASRGLRASLL